MRGAGDRCQRRGRRRPPPPLRDGLRHARCNFSNCVFGCRAVRQTPDLWLGWEVFGQRDARCQSAIVGVLGASARRPPPLRGLACHQPVTEAPAAWHSEVPFHVCVHCLREVQSPCWLVTRSDRRPLLGAVAQRRRPLWRLAPQLWPRRVCPGHTGLSRSGGLPWPHLAAAAGRASARTDPAALVLLRPEPPGEAPAGTLGGDPLLFCGCVGRVCSIERGLLWTAPLEPKVTTHQACHRGRGQGQTPGACKRACSARACVCRCRGWAYVGARPCAAGHLRACSRCGRFALQELASFC